MKDWVSEQCFNTLSNTATDGSRRKIFYTEIRKPKHREDNIKNTQTTLINVTGRTTNNVQPLDFPIDKPFKDHLRGHSIITFSLNDAPPPLVRTCSILVTTSPAKVQNFTSTPTSFHHHHYPISKSYYFIDS